MYFPSSKISENQYTSGGEYERRDNHDNYIGTYCILSDGRYFTGVTLTNSSIELIKTVKNPKKTASNKFIPFNLINKTPTLINLKEQIELKPSTIKPTEEDYKKGKITRYFAKKLYTIQTEIFEINLRDYNDVSKGNNKYLSIYQGISLDWKITGPDYDILTNKNFPIYGVIDTNKRTLEIKEKEMKGITKYFDGRLKEFAK